MTEPKYHAVYPVSPPGDEPREPLARYATADGALDYVNKWGADDKNIVVEGAAAALVNGMKVSWQVRIIYDETSNDPGEVLYGGFTTEEDAAEFANSSFFDGDDFSECVLELVNLVVFE